MGAGSRICLQGNHHYFYFWNKSVHISIVLVCATMSYYCVYQVPAGLFIPSMFVGACYGRIFGIVVQQLVM